MAMIRYFSGSKFSLLLAGAALLFAVATTPASAQSVSEAEALRLYEEATAAGRHAEAAGYILKYMEQTEGENAPLTVSLTHRYGNLLREDGDIPEAIAILKTARERAIVAYGEHGMELFEINLDLGDTYVDREVGLGSPIKYFNYALEVLRENEQRETVLYVKTLVGITSRLTQAGALGGALSADTASVQISNPGGDDFETLIGSGLSSLTHTYASGYRIIENYVQEAKELAEVLGIEDPYLGAKVAIVEAKVKVIDNLFLDAVPVSVRGSVTNTAIREEYQSQDANLAAAIEILMQDPELNQQFVTIANSARMDIAWLGEDMAKLTEFCSSNTLNMASQYPRDRLFRIEEDGSVIAPPFAFRISDNIFKRLRASRFADKDPNPQREKKPQFIPVCIDGRLMAALINAPRVTIEEFE